MKLYYTKGACSLVPRIVINELQLPCEFESVDLKNKRTEKGDNFYTINPKGSVPVLITNHHETLTENAVILQYLADSAKAEQLLPPIGNMARYRVLEWLNFITTELHTGFGPLFNPNFPQEVKDNIIVPILKRKLGFVNNQLEHNKFILGEYFTLPDAYLFVMMTWAIHFKLNITEWPHLSRYFSDLKERKSIQQSLQEEGLLEAVS
ncbi:MAG: glutathione transferase GstA [Gammaproteobacteria bacterium]|nr:glutathione transferase GstA [Gammaproteobacteria bacterium]MCW5583027.1 glutathione transferase GstA [Gammaproteobacteria bacterium]